MHTHIKTNFLFYTFTLLISFNFLFLINTPAQVGDGPAIGSASENYTFETIDVPGVDFLALTASSDFEDYAGYTKSADGEKTSALHSLMAFSRHTISPVPKTPISMPSGMMGALQATTKIARVCTTVLSWKMGSCGNTISPMLCKQRYTVFLTRREY